MKAVCSRLWIVTACCLGITFSPKSHADQWCVLSNFTVEAFDHGGVYLSGYFADGSNPTYIDICGITAGTEDCVNAPGTSRREAIALAAQASGHTLNLYFPGLTTCTVGGTSPNDTTVFQPYMRAQIVQMMN